ncbi:MAG: hypothetical protein ACKODM_04810, partial [Cytophagales bacterium]
IAYVSDCSYLSKVNIRQLKNLKVLIIDCLKFKKHKTHLSYHETINYIKVLKPKKAILTNLHSDIDYNVLKKKISKYNCTRYQLLPLRSAVFYTSCFRHHRNLSLKKAMVCW